MRVDDLPFFVLLPLAEDDPCFDDSSNQSSPPPSDTSSLSEDDDDDDDDDDDAALLRGLADPKLELELWAKSDSASRTRRRLGDLPPTTRLC